MASEPATPAEVDVQIDGAATRALEGQTVAALLTSSGTPGWRRTSGEELRGAFCGIGMCNDCVVTVDGVARVKACLMPVRDGMRILTQGKRL